MKLANILLDGRRRTAVETSEGIGLFVDGTGDALSIALAGQTPSIERLIGPEGIDFQMPVLAPGKVICVGINYRDHASEVGAAEGEYPSLFIRFPDSLVPHRANVVAPANSVKFDFEGELAVVIGREARHVSEHAVLGYVAGYSCFADNSVRDFQAHSRQVTAGKNFPSSGAFGPWLATAEDVDPTGLTLTTRLNGQMVQHASTSDLVFGVASLVSYISSFTTLLPGDVIATGTPAGVGALRTPQLWMKPGDTLEIEIPGVGTLMNTVIVERGNPAPISEKREVS